MMQTGTFQDFLDGELAVMVPSSKSRQYKALMQKCAERKLTWFSGHAPEKFTPRTCLRNITISVMDGRLFCGQRSGETLPVVRYEDLIETDAGLIHCKDCAHLCYEDLGVYYCGNLGICGQLSPDDYCSRGERKEKRHENH